jgi:hypothetical protein
MAYDPRPPKKRKQSKPKEKGKDVCKKRPQKSFKKQVLLRDPSDDEWDEPSEEEGCFLFFGELFFGESFGESPEYPASWMGALHEVQMRVTVSVFSSWSVSSSKQPKAHQRRESSPSRRKRARTSAKSAHKSHSKSKYYWHEVQMRVTVSVFSSWSVSSSKQPLQ